MANKLRVKKRPKSRKRAKDGSKQLHLARAKSKQTFTAVENLKMRLTSPRLRSPRTLEDYVATANQFMRWLGHDGPPTADDFRRYFIYRRDNDISERTLRKEFFQLKRLAGANSWPWPFNEDEAPVSEEEEFQPAHKVQEIVQLIEARDKYTKAEVFYLAVATTWGCRREELARIKKRDWDGDVLKLWIAKRRKWNKHLIPKVLEPIFASFHPSLETPTALTYIYHRICEKAGVPHGRGWGWHSIRRTVETMLKIQLVKNDLPESWVADYMGWAKASKGRTFADAAMVGVYDHPEIMDSDPWHQERKIIEIHPFLQLWAGEVPAACRPEK